MRREFSAGGVVFKKQKGLKSVNQIFWLITKSKANKDHPKEVWRLPKGWIDDEKGKRPGPLARGEKKVSEDKLQKAALREVREEGGVEARIIQKIGVERFFFKIKSELVLKLVTFYLMEWKKDLPEGYGIETSETAWLPYRKARKKLIYSGEKKMLDKAKAILKDILKT